VALAGSIQTRAGSFAGWLARRTLHSAILVPSAPLCFGFLALFQLLRRRWCGGGGGARVPFQPFAACDVIDPSPLIDPVPISPEQSVKLVMRDLLSGQTKYMRMQNKASAFE